MHIRAGAGAARHAEADSPARPSRGAQGLARGWPLGLVLCGAAAAWLAVVWSPGDRATPDSAFYIDGARHLAAGTGFATALTPIGELAPRPIATFGPGFSALMVPATWLAGNVLEGASLVLGASYVAYALATFLLLATAAGNALWPLAALATFAVIARPGTLEALDAILSDLPAAALTTTAFWLALRLVRRPTPTRGVALAIGSCLAAAGLIRWSSLLLLAALSAGLWLALRERLGPRERLLCLAWIALPTALLVAPWLLRNLARTGTLVGGRPFELFDPYLQGSSALRGALTGFFQSRQLMGSTLYSFGYSWLAIIAGGGWLVLCLRAKAWEEPGLRLLWAGLFGYALLLILSASVQSIDPLSGSRFWLPGWPLLWALVLAVIAGARGPAPLRVGVAAGLALTVLASLAVFALHVARALPEADTREDYLGGIWLDSATTVATLLEDHPGCALVSNDPRAILVHLDLPQVYRLPERADAFETLLSAQADVCIVFFRAGSPSVEKRRTREVRMLNGLRRRGSIRRAGGDDLTEIWVSS